jgi:hypothetical protein
MVGGAVSGGRCRANIYIDGTLVTLGVIDDMLAPEWVGAIEVYPHAASVPAEFQRGITNCGVVAFWTRERESGTKWSWKRVAVAAAFVAGAVVLIR